MSSVSKVLIVSKDLCLLSAAEGTPQKKSPTARTAGAEENVTVNDSSDKQIVVRHESLPGKVFRTMQAQLALRGYELRQRVYPGDDGVVLFEVGRHGQWRVYSCWSDVAAFAASVRVGV